MNATDGQQVWEAATELTLGFSDRRQVAVDEANQRLYLVEDRFQSGRLIAIDRQTGEVVWVLGNDLVDQEEPTFAGSLVLLKDGKLFLPVGVYEDYFKKVHLVQVDSASQQIAMQYDQPSGIDPGMDIIWYGMCNEFLFASYDQTNAETGKTLAAYRIDSPQVLWQMETDGMSAPLACNPQIGRIYVPTEKGLLAMEASSGNMAWEYQSIKNVLTPTVANGLVYFLSDTNLYALDEASGTQLFRFGLGEDAGDHTGVLVNDGLVIFSGNGGRCDLYTLGLK